MIRPQRTHGSVSIFSIRARGGYGLMQWRGQTAGPLLFLRRRRRGCLPPLQSPLLAIADKNDLLLFPRRRHGRLPRPAPPPHLHHRAALIQSSPQHSQTRQQAGDKQQRQPGVRGVQVPACNSDCPLAPFFPVDQQRRFLHAHRLFGVSNILKTHRRLRPDLCADAMATLVFQAEMRAQDPVGGCYRIVLALERQLEAHRAELAAVLHHLALCSQAVSVPPPQPGDLDVASSNQNQALLLLDVNADDQEVVVDDALYANHHHHQDLLQTTEDHPPHEDHHSSPQHHGELFDYFYLDTTTATGEEDAGSSKPLDATLDINVDPMQQEFDYDQDQKPDINVHEEEELVTTGHQQQDDVHCHVVEDYCEMKAAPLLVDVFHLGQQAVDVNAEHDGIDVKAVVDVNANINIDALDVNAQVDLNEELQENDTKNNVVVPCEAQQIMESSQCRLEGLAFSAL
jgi:hypothetical protein